jgi:hypothetical protein
MAPEGIYIKSRELKFYVAIDHEYIQNMYKIFLHILTSRKMATLRIFLVGICIIGNCAQKLINVPSSHLFIIPPNLTTQTETVEGNFASRVLPRTRHSHLPY